MALEAGRTPEYLLKARPKGSNDKYVKVGAAWANESGSISITLDPFVVLSANDRMSLVLYPNEG